MTCICLGYSCTTMQHVCTATRYTVGVGEEENKADALDQGKGLNIVVGILCTSPHRI